MASLRTGTIKVVEALTLTNAATTAPTDDSNGVAVPDGFRHEYAHILCTKTNVADFDLYGLVQCGTTSLVNHWFFMDQVVFRKTAVNESALMRGVAGVLRLCPVRTDANVINAGKVYFGFHEAHGVS